MKVITYGTFDLFHEGHRRLLERARELGDHLVVGVTTDNYDGARGKLNVRQSLMERIRGVERSGLADEVIIEEYEGQKIHDIQKMAINVFAIGSDWTGTFDYLREYCEVVYIDRTQGISSTQLRTEANSILRIGIVGAGRIANRFVTESKFVSGIHLEGVFSRNSTVAESFRSRHHLRASTPTFEELLSLVDAVYVATPHDTHFEYAKAAINQGVHVLCEKPLTLSRARTEELYSLALEKDVVLLEALKTAFSPGFQRMVAVARSGSIGEVRSVDATFTKLESGDLRELHGPAGGSISELASYPLLAVVKILGMNYGSISTHSFRPSYSEVDLFSRINLSYPHATASVRVGLGVKAEGDLVVGGTKGYLYVPAPWWKTEYFEVRFEDQTDNKRYYYKFDGDGLRYEISEFLSLINSGSSETFKLRPDESILIAELIEQARMQSIDFA
jgi:glycerol-3-phosphate cytidylyltransferase